MSGDDILVLTTREKEWWLSLQEIIPAIDRVWAAVGRTGLEHVRTLCVPLTSELEQELHTSAAQLKRIVITSVTPGTVEVALLLRSQLKAAAPMTVYIHGDATEGLEAFRGLSDIVSERDTFVVSCQAEAVAMRACFPNARIEVIPFPLVDQFRVRSGGRDPEHGTTRLAYVGRISEQKNLHTLLFALWLMRTVLDGAPNVTLDVYGGEDDLGSPNMGLKFPGYGAYLRELTESLGLADVVRWHGPKPRDWLFYNVHQEPHVFVSPTVHSDENFGSSVLASLVNGRQVVTTAWGGHFGFREWFPRQLTLVPVHRSTMGPVVHPVSLANAIMEAVESKPTAADDATLDRARVEFSEREVVARTIEMLGRPDGDPVPLKRSTTQDYLDARRARFGGTRKIYAGYEDPIARIFFEAYGMEEPLAFDERSTYILAPWVSYSAGLLLIADPHRGLRPVRLGPADSNPLKVITCPSMDTWRLPEDVVRSLAAQGSAFALPST
ncbi:glycosyltransferase [Glycomyces niveus]|uniref:Glycosyltransferase n=1 Tax=Glycomyces niveus TaxID=2820287 RepID=A0ABS3U2V4_9ACTN|nr:glycosyltransferase [Glycomyces sp. NEAU-S30]MBO3733103.1 glycosyltransferase [Glycomyces sp. NEAU-S30]